METEQDAAVQPPIQTLCSQLGIVDDTLGFLLLLIAATLFSFWSVVLQRKGLCLTIGEKTAEAAQLPSVFPIKLKASAIVVGALGFFLCLAISTLETAEEGKDCVAKQSARSNLVASLFVLAAGVLRLCDLIFVEESRPALVTEGQVGIALT